MLHRWCYTDGISYTDGVSYKVGVSYTDGVSYADDVTLTPIITQYQHCFHGPEAVHLMIII